MDYKGFTEYESRDFDALNLFLRSIGTRALKDLEQLHVTDASWDDLHKTRKAVMSAAKAALRSIEGADNEDENRKASGAHDLLMASLDYIDGEMDRRKSHGQTTPLTADQRGLPVGLGGTVISHEDGSSEFVPFGEERTSGRSEWRDKRGKPVRVLRPSEKLVTEHRGLGVGDVAKAMIYGPSNDAERRALSEGTDSAGGYTVPTRLASFFIDKLRAAAVVFQAGAQTVPMDSDNLAIARITGDPTCAWTAENAEISASDPTFDAVTLAPKKLAALVKVSRELLEDSVNIGAALEAAFVGAMSRELDRALLFGSGSSNQPTGLFNISGINSVSMGTNGAAVTNFDNLIDLLLAIKEDNGATPNSFIMAPRTEAAYAKLKDSDNNPLTEPRMTAELRRLVTTAVPIDQTQGSASNASCVLTGDFSKMLVGVRTQMSMHMLNERYAEYDQVGFLVRLRADVAVEQPVHFGRLIGVIPPA
jgi:HK97 family phage major capsid protein